MPYTVQIRDGDDLEETIVDTHEEALAELADYARSHWGAYTRACWHKLELGDGQRALPVPARDISARTDAEIVEEFFAHAPMTYTILAAQDLGQRLAAQDDDVCDECGHTMTGELISTDHAPSCTLHPSAVATPSAPRTGPTDRG